MPNPAGVNDLNRVASLGYGEGKRQQQLIREAPISGAPLAAHAQNTPQRSQRRAVRGTAAPANPPPVAEAPPQPTYQAQLAAVWQQVAAQPGASPLVQQYAAEAQQ